MKKPKFMEQLRAILDDPANYDMIRWINVDRFAVVDPDGFATTVVPRYFKHASFSSFSRQLYAYGFHKQTLSNGSVEFYRAAGQGEESEIPERKKTTAQAQVDKLKQQIDELKSENQTLQEANHKLMLQLNLQGGLGVFDNSSGTPDQNMAFNLPNTPPSSSIPVLTSQVQGPFEDFYMDDSSMMPSYASSVNYESPFMMGPFPALTRVPSLEEGKVKVEMSSESFGMDVDTPANEMLMDNYFRW